MALLELLGAREAVHDYKNGASIRTLTLDVGGVSFVAQMEVAR
jgi:hypothetical protein